MGCYQVPGEEAKGCDFMGVQFHGGGGDENVQNLVEERVAQHRERSQPHGIPHFNGRCILA